MIPPNNYREYRQREGRAFQHPVRATIIAITLTLLLAAALPGQHDSTTTNHHDSTGTGLIELLLLIALYFLPTIIARHRRLPSRNSILVLNFAFGWLIVPWIICLAMSVARANNN